MGRGEILSDGKDRFVKLTVFQGGPATENIDENRERILDKVDEIAEGISNTRLDEYNGEQDSYLTELEMELEINVVETNGDFWKG